MTQAKLKDLNQYLEWDVVEYLKHFESLDSQYEGVYALFKRALPDLKAMFATKFVESIINKHEERIEALEGKK